MCRPRWRGDTGFCSSGYCTVIGCVPIFFSVNARPFAISLITVSPSAPSCPERDDRAGDDDVDQAEREQHLPSEVHQPVIAQPWECPAHPDHHEEQYPHLAEEPDRSRNPVEGM